MSSNIAEALNEFVQERGISEDNVLKMIEETLKAAYKRKFGRNENAVVEFSDDRSEVSIFSKKMVVDGVYDPLTEIELKEALELDPECEEGDELLIEVDPKSFDRVSVQSGKQTARQSARDIQKDSLYADFKEKEGGVVIGYCQRKRGDNIFVDLGKIEGILPKRFQSPRENYAIGEKIKAYVYEVKKTPTGLQVVLSRTAPEFVGEILELEIPEVYDKTVEIYKIVREAGYRTKVAVFSRREDVDPVGACIGIKGSRIQNVIEELSGEKIDIVPYSEDPAEFIKNALSPAEVEDVVITDKVRRSACAIVSERQFSLAVGKEGRNVRLANRLVDWNIDVKTKEDFAEMDGSSRRAIDSLFSGDMEEADEEAAGFDSLPEELTALLQGVGIESLEAARAKSREELFAIEGMTDEFKARLEDALDGANKEEEAPPLAGSEEEEEFECPECGAKITIDMTSCPNCGVELSFEYEDDEDGE